MPPQPEREVSRGPWWLGLLLRLYPRDIRQEHGEEILEFVNQERRTLASPSFARVGWLYLCCALDMMRGAARARLRSSSRPSSATRLPSGAAWLRDTVHALRSIRSSPLLSAAIVVTLALAIGMNTATFSVVHGVLLEPFPYRAPDRLVYIGARWVEDDVERALHTGRDFELFQESLKSFDGVAALTTIRQNLTGGDVTEQVEVGWASRNFFEVLGVPMQLGPGFTEDAPPGTLVLSDPLFQEKFAGDPSVLGSGLELDGRMYTIAGVLPSDFELHFPSLPPHVDVWKVPDDWWQNGDFWSASGASFAILRVVARLSEHKTLADARHELESLAAVMRERSAEHARVGLSLYADSLHSSVVGGVRSILWILLGASGLVLAVACANVTNMLLVRARRRQPELAVRRALGASRGSIVRLLFLDSVVYAAAGGVAGIGLGYAGVRFLGSLRPEGLPRWRQVAVDLDVLAFAVALAAVSTVAAGLLPAWRAASRRGEALLGSSGSARSRRHLLSNAIVVGQMAASTVPLVGAALLYTSLARLSEVEPGFETGRLMTFSVSLPGTSYERPLGTDRFFRALTERVESLPGVSSAAVIWPLPLSGQRWLGQYTAGGVSVGARAYAQYSVVTPDVFDTLRVPLVVGRSFTPSDPRHVVVVSENLAKRAFPGESPLGRRMTANPWGGGSESFEIIGVARDVHYTELRDAAPETIYFDSRGWSWTDWEVNVAVRTDASPESLVPLMRSELAELDLSIPLSQARPMRGYVDDQLARNRLAMSLIGVFALVAACLSVVGLYGVVSFTTSERTREIGVRMALGAARSRVLGGVLWRGVSLSSVGVGLGLVGAWFLTRGMESLLFRVSATDATIYASVATVLTVTAILASFVPAHRATRIEPVRVLRAE